MKQAFEELGIGTINDIKNFYLNDIINYHQETYKKVCKLYDEFKAKKHAEKISATQQTQFDDIKTEAELKVDEFIRENDL